MHSTICYRGIFISLLDRVCTFSKVFQDPSPSPDFEFYLLSFVDKVLVCNQQRVGAFKGESRHVASQYAYFHPGVCPNSKIVSKGTIHDVFTR